MTPRALFITIGQTPRPDLMPEIREWLGGRIDAEERGALDGLGAGDLAAMAPGPRDHRLVTRLADGSEVVLRKDLVHARVQGVLDSVATDDYLCTVVLCSGQFPPFRVRGLFLDAQAIVDESVTAISRHVRSLGLMLPIHEQIEEFHFRPAAGQTLKASYASPYTPGRLAQASCDLADTDLIVMHCMGYTEEMRQTVAGIAKRPVLLARRLVAAAVAQLA